MTTKQDLTRTSPASQAGAETSEAAASDSGVVRGRPGRRTLVERKEAVLQVLMGKASIDQVAAQMGVWRESW
ncbi:MAG: hypothetical protein FJ100_22515 [Deltaproteobacteria bacterium]|nr:hypothetical protein [Deltaproteobacteria bacterium]